MGKIIRICEDLSLKRCKSKKHPFYPILVIVYYSIIREYGYESLIEIDKLTNIIFNNPDDNFYTPYARCELVLPNNNLYSIELLNMSKIDLFLNDFYDNTVLLTTTMHEFNHIRKSILNRYVYKRNKDTHFDLIYCRSGISYNTIVNGILISENNGIDEVFNVLETNDLLKKIKYFNKNKFDDQVRDFLNKINLDFLYDSSYFEIVNLFKDIWNDKSFKRIISANLYSGDIDTIIEYFNSKFPRYDFYEFSRDVDKLYYASIDRYARYDNLEKKSIELKKRFKKRGIYDKIGSE